jgi:hypothetical protein
MRMKSRHWRATALSSRTHSPNLARRSGWAFIAASLIAAIPQSALAADASRDIVDYFRIYYARQVSNSSALQFISDAASAHTSADQLLNPAPSHAVIVDRKNGYLQIDDSSGLDQILTMALYRKPDGSALIVVGTSDCDDACDFSVQFFGPAGDGLRAVDSARVLPAVSASQFIKAGHPMPKAVAGIEPKIDYVPARAGTDLALKPWYGYEAEAQMDAATRSAIQNLTLRWDRNKGVFATAPVR